MCEFLHINKTRTSVFKQMTGSNALIALWPPCYSCYVNTIRKLRTCTFLRSWWRIDPLSIPVLEILQTLWYGKKCNVTIGGSGMQTFLRVWWWGRTTCLYNRIYKVNGLTRENLKKTISCNKRHYDTKALKRTLEKGQSVWLYDITHKVVCLILTSSWKGPCLVLKTIDDISNETCKGLPCWYLQSINSSSLV